MILPNTRLRPELLAEDVVLCAGEDVDELLDALGTATDALPREEHAYRCYRFLRYDRFTLAWTGIGSGCLEPLMGELLPFGIVRRIVLFGTAGAMRPGGVAFAEPHYVARAWLGATAITPHDDTPLVPMLPNTVHLPEAGVVSSDFYYGFSTDATDPLAAALQSADARLAQRVQHFAPQADLVDMESAQFYWLCRTLGDPALQYASVKAAANVVAAWEEQPVHTPNALANAAGAVLRLLRVS